MDGRQRLRHVDRRRSERPLSSPRLVLSLSTAPPIVPLAIAVARRAPPSRFFPRFLPSCCYGGLSSVALARVEEEEEERSRRHTNSASSPSATLDASTLLPVLSAVADSAPAADSPSPECRTPEPAEAGASSSCHLPLCLCGLPSRPIGPPAAPCPRRGISLPLRLRSASLACPALLLPPLRLCGYWGVAGSS